MGERMREGGGKQGGRGMGGRPMEKPTKSGKIHWSRPLG